MDTTDLNNLKNILIWIVCLLLLASCKDCTTEPLVDDRNTTINLELTNTWTTSCTFRISVIDTSDSWTFGLMRDDSIVITQSVTGKDTVISDRGLEPNTQYWYQACWMKKGVVKDTSEEIIAITMDTTSHNISWEMDLIGEYYSILRDVVIIDANTIWAVGEIKTDSGTFNAVKWEDDHWQIFNIEAYYGTALINPPMYSIQYISDDDIWALGSYPFHRNGVDWTLYHLTDMGIIPGGLSGALWANNSSNVYFVGRYGRIINFNGSSFRLMETDTDINLVDIYGRSDDEIWVCGATSDAGKGVLLEKSGDSWKTIIKTDMSETGTTAPYDTLFGSIDGIWIPEEGDSLWLANGWGIFKYSISSGKFRWVYPRWWTQNDSYGTLFTIRGTTENNLFACGKLGTILHYNGVSWKWFKDFNVPYMWFYSIAIIDDLIVIVGSSPEGKAVIVRGHHN